MKLEHYPSLQSFGEKLDELGARDVERSHSRAGVWSSRINRTRLVVVATACIAAAVATGAVLTFSGGSPHIGLAQRAYAEVTAPGIAHWRVTVKAYRNGVLTATQAEEGWARDGVSHTVLTAGPGAGERTERRVADGQESFRNGDGPLQNGPAGETDLQRALPGSDPFSAFRAAYGADRLEQSGPDSFRVTPTASTAAVSLTYYLDPQTADPKAMIETSGDGAFRVVTSFELYEHIPDTAANEQLLEIRGR
jgi:hypothetical protein